MKHSIVLFLLLLFLTNSQAQTDFYSIQPLGHHYIYDSKYFDQPREIQVYQNGVNGNLQSDSILSIYVMDAQYPPTFNLFCSTFELLFPNTPCVIIGISNPERQSELTPPFTDSIDVKGYDNPGHADNLLLSLKNEIIPFISKKYHTDSNRILVGHSLGGTFVTYAMINDTELFPCIIAISPNYAYSKEMMIDKIKKWAERPHNNKSYIYLAHGQKDKIEEKFLPATQKVYQILKDNPRIVLKYDSLNIEKHSHTIFEGYYRGLLMFKDYLK